MSGLLRIAAHSTGKDRMNNTVIIAVFLIAIAQALTILLTVRRERDIKELREFFNEQRLDMVKLTAWLTAGNVAQPLTKSEREPIREPLADNMKAPEPAKTSKDLPSSLWEAARRDRAPPVTEAKSAKPLKPS
jgi:hypothetical protein